MIIKKFNENSNSSITHETLYKLCRIKLNSGEEQKLEINRDTYTYDNHNLSDISKLYLKLKGYEKNWYIKKIDVTEEIVDLATIPEIDIILKQRKYNL
jgi:hypothetical protein